MERRDIVNLLCLPRWKIKSKVCWTNTLATTVHSIHKTRQSISHSSPVEKTLLFSTIRNKYCHRVRWVFLVCNRTLRNRAKPDTPHPLYHQFLSVIHSLSYSTNIYEVSGYYLPSIEIGVSCVLISSIAMVFIFINGYICTIKQAIPWSEISGKVSNVPDSVRQYYRGV